MKVILTGATGFVGGEVLSQLLRYPEVTRVTCLTRRAPGRSHEKLRILLHSDLGAYSDAQLEQLANHDACIWCLGGKVSDARSLPEYERTTHTLTLAFARAVLPPRFCYLSGMGVDPSESSRIPWERETRFLKGRTERDLSALAREAPPFSPFFFRPGGILPGPWWLEGVLAPIVVRVDVLARAMIRVALHGNGERVINNARIKALG